MCRKPLYLYKYRHIYVATTKLFFLLTKNIVMALARSTDDLIGIRNLESLVNLNQLPTVRQALQRFQYYLKETKSVCNASHSTVEEIEVVWATATIPIMLRKHTVEKLERVHDTWLLLKKNRGGSLLRHSKHDCVELSCKF